MNNLHYLKTISTAISICFFIMNCSEEPTEPNQSIECPDGYSTCISDADTLTCCPEEIPMSATQSHVVWPGLADTPWPMYMHDPQHTGRSQYDGPEHGEIEWTSEIGTEVFSNPVIDHNGNIIVSARQDLGGFQKLFSLTTNGIINWTVEFGGHIDSTPLISADNYIYICHSAQNAPFNLYLVKLDLNGNVIWEKALGLINDQVKGTFSPNISIDGKTIFISGADSSLFAINKNGNLRWKNKLVDDYFNAELSISPNGESIYLTTTMNKLMSIDTSGTIHWSTVVSPPSLTSKNSLSAPVLDSEGNLYVYSNFEGIYSFNSDGYLRWKTAIDNFAHSYNNGLTIGPFGGIHMTSYPIVASFNYDGSLRWKKKNYVNQNRLILDRRGYSYLGLFSSREYTSDNSIINFISLNNSGSVRYNVRLGPDTYTPDIDSPGAIYSNGSYYVGSDAGSPNFLFSIK